MSDEIDIFWHYEDQVVMLRPIGDLTSEMMKIIDERLCVDFLDQSTADYVHLIFDHTHVQAIPPIGKHTSYQFSHHPRRGWCVSFGDNELTRFFVSSFGQINRVTYQVCPSPDECLAFLSDMDATLPSALPEIAMRDEAA